MESKKEIQEPLPNDGVVDIDYENEQNKPDSSRMQLFNNLFRKKEPLLNDGVVEVDYGNEQNTQNSSSDNFFKKITATIKNIVHKKDQESEGVVEAFDQNVHSTDRQKKTDNEIVDKEDLSEKLTKKDEELKKDNEKKDDKEKDNEEDLHEDVNILENSSAQSQDNQHVNEAIDDEEIDDEEKDNGEDLPEEVDKKNGQSQENQHVNEAIDDEEIDDEEKDNEEDLPEEVKEDNEEDLPEEVDKKNEQSPKYYQVETSLQNEVLTIEDFPDHFKLRHDLSKEGKMDLMKEKIKNEETKFEFRTFEFLVSPSEFVDGWEPIVEEIKEDKEVLNAVVKKLLSFEPETPEEKLKKVELLCGSEKSVGLLQEDGLNDELKKKAEEFVKESAKTVISTADYETMSKPRFGKFVSSLQKNPEIFKDILMDTLIEDPDSKNQDRDQEDHDLVLRFFLSSTQMTPGILEEVSEKIVKKDDLPVEQKAEALKNLYKETNSEDATKIGVKYIKELLNNENVTPELAESFFHEPSFASELRKDEKIINKVVKDILEQTEAIETEVRQIDNKIKEMSEEIVAIGADSDEKKKEKEEEIKEKKQEKADMLERAQVEKVWLLLGSTYSDKGLLQEEKLDPDLKERATDDIQNTIANTSSYAVLVAARNNSMAWHDESIKEAIKKGEQNVAQKMLNETIEIEDRNDFHAMLDIAGRKGAEKITKTPEFAEKFANCVSKRYEYLEEQINTNIGEKQQKAYFEEYSLFHNMKYTLKKNSDLAKDRNVREVMLNCIEKEIDKSEGYGHVANAEKIGDIFNKLFETPDANNDKKLVEVAVKFFEKELNKDFNEKIKNESSPFIEDTTLVALCSNKNFTKNNYLKKLAIDGLVESIDNGYFSDTVLDTLKTEEAYKQFAETINSIKDENKIDANGNKIPTKKDIILSGFRESIEDLESEKDRQEIIKIVSLLSPEEAAKLKDLEEKRKKEEEEEKKKKEEKKEEKQEPQLSGENKPNLLESLNNISSVSNSNQQSIAGSAGRNNNNDRSL